jgi:hypothetical protein
MAVDPDRPASHLLLRRSTQASICCLSRSMVRSFIVSSGVSDAFSQGKLDTAILRDSEMRLKRLSRRI